MSQVRISQLPSLSGVQATAEIPVSQQGRTFKISFDSFKDSLEFDDVVRDDDPRLTDSRDPNAHSFTHSLTGTDPISPESIGAVTISDEGYTVTIANTVKTFDANTATVNQLYDVVATLIDTLKTKGVI
jgi:hypothetical protein